MTISFKKNEAESQLIAHIEGCIDTAMADLFQEQMNAAVVGIKRLILDFSDVDYITSSGLRAIFNLNKRMAAQGTMCLKHVNSDVREVFEISGVEQFIDIQE